MITPEVLKEKGFKKLGNAWYRNSAKLTYVNGIWEVWILGISREIKEMKDL